MNNQEIRSQAEFERRNNSQMSLALVCEGTKAPVNQSARGMGMSRANWLHACRPFKEEIRGKKQVFSAFYSTVTAQFRR